MHLPEDTLEAYNKIVKIRERLMKGEDLKTLAMQSFRRSFSQGP